LNNIVLKKRTNAMFLAIVLVAGTITLSPASFMVGKAQATSDHEKNYDKYDKKSYRKDRYDDRKSYEKDNYKSTEYTSYEKDNNSYKSKDNNVKCNNINANLNGFNGLKLNALPPAVNALATDEAQAEDEGEIGASSFGSGERYSGNFDLDCINTNNSVGGQGGTGSQGPQGPRGIQGERGERGLPGEDGEDGAPGSNQINPALIYSVIGTSGSGTSDAKCELGDVVLGGQFQITSGAGHSMGEITNLRAGSSSSGSYSVSITTLSGSIQGVQANAICFDNPPLKQQLLNQLP
jgi:hypothetical protein